MADQVIKANELVNYNFGEEAAPAGMNPDAEETNRPPDGWHLFELTDFGLVQNKLCKGRDFGEWTGNQLRPTWAVAPGQPHAGASIMDFLPMPTPNTPQMPKSLANRWANFMRAIGLQLPADKLIPPGFTLQGLLTEPRRRAYGRVVTETYTNAQGIEKTTTKIGFFAYKPLTNPPDMTAPPPPARTQTPATAAAPLAPAAAPLAPAAAPPPVDLSGL